MKRIFKKVLVSLLLMLLMISATGCASDFQGENETSMDSMPTSGSFTFELNSSPASWQIGSWDQMDGKGLYTVDVDEATFLSNKGNYTYELTSTERDGVWVKLTNSGDPEDTIDCTVSVEDLDVEGESVSDFTMTLKAEYSGLTAEQTYTISMGGFISIYDAGNLVSLVRLEGTELETGSLTTVLTLPTAAEVSAAFEGKTFAGFADDMAVLISAKDGSLATSFGTSGFTFEIEGDYTIEEGKNGASYTLSYSNDVFWNVYLDEQGEIESVNFVHPDYLETGLDISCTRVADNDFLDSSDFLDKFASGYTTSATYHDSDLGKDVTVYMVLDYEDGNILLPVEDTKISLAIGDKVIKVSDDEYVLVTSTEVAPSVVFTIVFGMTFEDGVVESLSIAGGNYSRDAIIDDESTVSEYTIGSDTLSSLHCNLPHEKFVELFMDEELVDEENYSIEEGSTIVKFTKDYLSTLSVGTHKVELKYDLDDDTTVDKIVETTITIKAKSNPTPQPEPTPTTPYKAPNTGVR